MVTTFKPAYDVMIHGFVRQLMETEGLSAEEARERLQDIVDDVCNEIIYGNDDE